MPKRSMNPLFPAAALLVGLGVAGSPPAWTADAVPAPRSAQASPGAPGAELQRLDALAGRWTVRQTMWTDAAKPPVVDHGTATFTAILGGRHLRQELHIDSKEKPFDGVGYLGYDGAAGKYDSLWMDVNFTGTIVAHGDYDAARRTYIFVGAMADPARSGTLSPLREMMRIQDADHFSYGYYERHGGKETLAVRLDYTRSR